MKKSIYLLLFISMISLSFYSFKSEKTHTKMSDATWENDFDQALALAKKKNKPLLVLFTGSDWCPPCKALEKDFIDSDSFKEIANENLILYKADFPRARDIVSPEQKVKNEQLKLKYGIRGFPTIIIVDGAGKLLERQVGYNPNFGTENHFFMIDRVLDSYR